MSALTYVFVVNAVLASFIAESNIQEKNLSSKLPQFKEKNVPNEYIVTYHSKYYTQVRNSFISKRLIRGNVCNMHL